MSDVLPKILLDEIESLIQNKAGDVKSRDARLRHLADTAWATLFPEDRQAGSQRPTNETRRHRWRAVINQLAEQGQNFKGFRVTRQRRAVLLVITTLDHHSLGTKGLNDIRPEI